jgi:hypothetical protein
MVQARRSRSRRERPLLRIRRLRLILAKPKPEPVGEPLPASKHTMSQNASSVDGDGVGEIRAGAPMTLGNAAAARERLIIVGLGSPLAGAGSIVSLVVY